MLQGDRESLTQHRRNMISWYSRLRAAVEAEPMREIASLEREIAQCGDPERRKALEWDLALTRARRPLFRTEDRMNELLQSR